MRHVRVCGVQVAGVAGETRVADDGRDAQLIVVVIRGLSAVVLGGYFPAYRREVVSRKEDIEECGECVGRIYPRRGEGRRLVQGVRDNS